MVEEKLPMKEIQSSDEIPTFSNEEEEVRFWDTHTLGDDLIALMGSLPEEILPIDPSRISRRVGRKHSLEKATNPTQLSTGQRVSLSVGDKLVDLLVISPDGLGPGQPKLGISLGTLSTLLGIPSSTIHATLERDSTLLSPSSSEFTLVKSIDKSGRKSTFIELSDFSSLVLQLVTTSRLKSPQMKAIGSFIHHFSALGFYADAYVSLKGSFSNKDRRSTAKLIGFKAAKWLEESSGYEPTAIHELYINLLSSEDENSLSSYWNNYIYKGLLGLNSGSSKYIDDSKVKEAIQFCEGLVVALFSGDLEEAHDRAIDVARSEFLCREVDITPSPVKS